MQFTFEVQSKVETLRMDGSTQYVCQGKLGYQASDDAEPQEVGQVGLQVAASTFEVTTVGDTWITSEATLG